MDCVILKKENQHTIDLPNTTRKYIAIDLKSFYASVECVERGLDPLDTCLVVADSSRTEKTIVLAVSPALKSFGLGGRPRLFEVVQRVRDVNRSRGKAGKSIFFKELRENPDLAVDYITAPPRMALYIDYSTKIYDIYLRYVAPEDMHVYSIDEVFIDATDYLSAYGMTAHDFAMMMIRNVLSKTGVTATAGIGDNLYLSKVAMDIVAKKMTPDKDGVRIAELSEMKYRKELWDHRPLTDFWRIGRGVVKRLAPYGITTMGDIAECSLKHEDLLYKIFGVNAELLIDHAWGWEPVGIKDIKSYRPETHSLSSGQVLNEPYTFDKARVVILEMADSLGLEMVEKGLVTDQIVIHIGYDVESLNLPEIYSAYHGGVKKDFYGRLVPPPAHGSANFHRFTSSSKMLIELTGNLFDRIVNPILLIRRLNLTASHVVKEEEVKKYERPLQLDLFGEYEERRKENEDLSKERNHQRLILDLQKKFGKNVILKGLNFADGATQKERNQQIGGHKA
ncbi:MAG: DNA methylase [Muribaculaceae bacterium]|nr:DNA methylase [Muribaculaceae bacterium]